MSRNVGESTRARSRRGALVSGAIAAVLAILAGTLAVVQPGAAAAIAAGLLLVGMLWLTGSPASRTSLPTDLAGKTFRWISFAWVFVLLRPIGEFSQGRSALSAAQGNASAENVLELALYVVIGLLAIASLRRNGLGRWPPAAVLALPSLALLSTAWSPDPLITLAFSFELFVIVLLATLTLAIFRNDEDAGRAVVRRVLRLIVQLVAFLCVMGLVLGGTGQAASNADVASRFTWPGAHPVVAAAQIGLAFLVVIFGRREASFSTAYSVAVIGLFSVCLYLGETRTALIALVVAALLGYFIASRGRTPLLRLLGGLAVAAMVVFVVGRYGGAVADYLYRGQSQQQVFSINGRIGLWGVGLAEINTPWHWIAGFGLGATRVLFASSVTWAGDAHSAWLELLLSLGLLGLVAGISLVVATGLRLFRQAGDAVLPVLFIYIVVMSPVGSGFGAPGPGPGLGFGLLAFAYAARAAARRTADEHAPLRRVGLQSELRSAPT